MKKAIFLFAAISFLLSSQNISAEEPKFPINQGKGQGVFTLGFLHGGGALIGADFEYLVADNIGLQLGAGFRAFGAGINYHLKPDARSSYLSLLYWHQGIGNTYVQSVVGPSYVFRAKKILQAQIGLGVRIHEGPNPTGIELPFMLVYSIGIYFPAFE